MAFESMPKPGNPEGEEERIRFEEGGRQFSMTPKEKEEHEKAEVRQRIMEGSGKPLEVKEGGKSEKIELTEEEEKLLEEMVPDAEMRARLAPEVIRAFLEAKREENEKAA